MKAGRRKEATQPERGTLQAFRLGVTIIKC